MSNVDSLILVINCGSSSLKFAIFPEGEKTPLMSGLAECLGAEDARITCKTTDEKFTLTFPNEAHGAALDALTKVLAERGWLKGVKAVGHRVVHGGEKFKASILVTEDVLKEIESLNHLAPLHNPANVLGIRTAIAKLPNIPQVAVFDTAFHSTMEPGAYLYALPMSLYRDYSVRRYGFHGTSHRYVSEEAIRTFGLDPNDSGIVVAHLGNGASATAVLNGKSVDTSMGMTPLEGLVMGTRSGDVDAGALVLLMRELKLDAKGLDELLNKKSGLLGVSELSNDMRTIGDAAKDGHDGASKALQVFIHRLGRYVGALVASLNRFDMLVFTGGIGENSALVRGLALKQLRAFGFELDEDANNGIYGGKSGIITKKGGKPVAAVIPTNEEWMIALDTQQLAQGAK